MGQHISPEAALAAFRQEYGNLADTNVLLRARNRELEQENAGLRARLEAAGIDPEQPQPQPQPDQYLTSQSG